MDTKIDWKKIDWMSAFVGASFGAFLGWIATNGAPEMRSFVMIMMAVLIGGIAGKF